jgi:AcrR family transcriptional regulator
MAHTLNATLQDRRRQQALDEIATVAEELFLRDGFGNVSVEDITAAAGCSPRTFYRYFGSKEDVLFYDLSPMREQWIKLLDDYLASELGPWNALTEAMAGLMEGFGGVNARLAVGRMKLWLTEPVLRAKYMEHMARTEDAVTNSLRTASNASPQDVELAPVRAVAAVGAYRVTLHEHHAKFDGPELARHLRNTCAAIGAGLGDHKPRRTTGSARAAAARKHTA